MAATNPTKKVMLTIYMDPDMRHALKVRALDERKSVTEIMVKLASEYLAKSPRKDR